MLDCNAIKYNFAFCYNSSEFTTMTKEELVLGLRKRIVGYAQQYYAKIFTKTEPTTDEELICVTEIFQKLDEKEKMLFLKLIRRVEVDTAAQFFSFLDQQFWVEGQDSDLNLVFENNKNELINEGLTDIFLNLEYTWKR